MPNVLCMHVNDCCDSIRIESGEMWRRQTHTHTQMATTVKNVSVRRQLNYNNNDRNYDSQERKNESELFIYKLFSKRRMRTNTRYNDTHTHTPTWFAICRWNEDEESTATRPPITTTTTTKRRDPNEYISEVYHDHSQHPSLHTTLAIHAIVSVWWLGSITSHCVLLLCADVHAQILVCIHIEIIALHSISAILWVM